LTFSLLAGWSNSGLRNSPIPWRRSPAGRREDTRRGSERLVV